MKTAGCPQNVCPAVNHTATVVIRVVRMCGASASSACAAQVQSQHSTAQCCAGTHTLRFAQLPAASRPNVAPVRIAFSKFAPAQIRAGGGGQHTHIVTHVTNSMSKVAHAELSHPASHPLHGPHGYHNDKQRYAASATQAGKRASQAAMSNPGLHVTLHLPGRHRQTLCG